MATSAIAATGTLMKIGDGGGPEVFTTIAEVMDITGPSLTTDIEDVTSHDSSGFHEYITTLKDSGEVTFDLNYFSATTQDSLRTDYTNKTRRNFQLVFPTTPAETWAFAALVTGLQPSAPVASALRMSVTLKVTGAVTVT